MKKIIKFLFLLILTAVALAVLGVVFWTQVKEWVYVDGFIGNDTPQFIHYVYYHFKHPGFPVNSWDYLWHNGVPRAIDTSYIHFFFTRPLVEALGFYQAIKAFPLISLAIFVLFTYLIFYELSRSVLLALGMAISLVLGRGLYEALFSGGVVMSAISQAWFPIQFYFLARFHRRGTYRNLLLAGVSSALGFYFHGMLMMFMGFIPSFVFVLFSTRKGEPLISKRSIKNSFLFSLIALTVGALGSWPYLLQGFQGGSFSVLIPGPGPRTKVETFGPLLEFIDKGIPVALIIGIGVLLISLIIGKKKRLLRAAFPFVALIFYALFWFITYNYGLHPQAGIIFPARFYWMWPLSLGALAAVFLSPLSSYKPRKKISGKLAQWLFSNLAKVVIFLVIVFSLLSILLNKHLAKEMIKVEPLETQDLAENYRNLLQNVLSKIDQEDIDWRIWSHEQSFNMKWILVSDVPLSGGYAHIYTRRSRLWEGWSYAVMSRPNYESQEIPRDMAEQQALFFLDWYGIKYINFVPGGGEWDIAPYLYQNGDYLDVLASDPDKGFLKLKPGLTSEIVSSVNVPVIGFVGNDEGYMTFLKNLAMLNLNTSHVIPLRLAQSPAKLTKSMLANVDGLVLYNFKAGGIFYSRGWNGIFNFVEQGGKVWIEGGGNSSEREKQNLPRVFPITASQYGSLGKDWQPGGEYADKINFSSLEPLVYRDTAWQVSYAPSGSVKPGAKVLLTQKGNPVAVEQAIGKGKVIWTGANFWYRPEEYRQNGLKEIVFVELFLNELMGKLSPKRLEAQVERRDPEHIQVRGQGFSGVVFKETNWPGWNAAVENGSQRKKVPVFAAGPELMYIPVPKEMREGMIEVSINYQGDPFNWLSFFISLTSFLAVVLYLIFGGRLFRRFLPKKITEHPRGIRMKVSSWWESEEE